MTLGANGATIAPTVTQSPYPDDTRNTTINTVASFYASQGITIAMGDDAATYALEWLTHFNSNNDGTTSELHSIHIQVIGRVRAGTIPAGLNNN